MSASRACRAAWLLLLWVGGCSELPGETLGTYKVTMTLKENTCGQAAVFSLDKKRYSVELRSDDKHAYWRIPGQTPIQGRYEEPEFEFQFRSVVASAGPDAGPNGCRLVQVDEVTGSLITRDDDKDKDDEKDAESDAPEDAGDELDAGADEPDADEEDASEDEEQEDELDASDTDAASDAGLRGDAGTTLEGEHAMTISAEPGTDCSRVALVPAGAFERLPCKLRYKLLGVPTKPF